MFLRNKNVVRNILQKMLEISNANIPSHTFWAEKKSISRNCFLKESFGIPSKRYHRDYTSKICSGIHSTNIHEFFFRADKSRAFSSTNLVGHISKKSGSHAPGMVLTTCEMYLRKELVKTSFET